MIHYLKSFCDRQRIFKNSMSERSVILDEKDPIPFHVIIRIDESFESPLTSSSLLIVVESLHARSSEVLASRRFGLEQLSAGSTLKIPYPIERFKPGQRLGLRFIVSGLSFSEGRLSAGTTERKE